MSFDLDSFFKQPLSKQFFDPNRETQLDNVRSCFGESTLFLSNEQLEGLLKRVNFIKTDVRSWGKTMCKQYMLSVFQRFVPAITHWRGLQLFIKNAPAGDETLSNWFDCMYTLFEDYKTAHGEGWEETMEREYMKDKQFTYLPDSNERDRELKGCIARMITVSIGDVRKNLNRYGRMGELGALKISRTAEEVKETGKYKKRKKGETLGVWNVPPMTAKRPPKEKKERVMSRLCLFVVFICCLLPVCF